MRTLFLALAVAAATEAGPADFGMAEFQRALEARGLDLRPQTGVTTDPPETYRIEANRITGGDLRGLMYGLLAAAEQIRTHGKLIPEKVAPAVKMRGIRYFLHNDDLQRDWYYSEEFWLDYFEMLARNRFNRFNLVFAHQTNYLAPPYPFWFEVEGFPEARVPGLAPEQRNRNIEMLRFISRAAAEHGIDFTLGIWQHDVQTNQKATVEGLTRANIGPYSHAALKKVLALCPAIRSVQMRTNSESGIPADYQVEFYRDWVWRALREAGRLVTLDLRGWVMQKGMLDAALASGVPVRLSSKYWAEDIGRPYQPAETWPNYSYINFLKKPRPYEFYWEVWGLGSHRVLQWGDPDFMRRIVPTFALSGSSGFEVDPPLAQKGFGNRLGKWRIGNDKYEWQRYWAFYLLWGRMSYDPTNEGPWKAELERRYGKSAPHMDEAYRAASRVLSEIVAAHLADPNMYIWPEVNPGGLIDAYKEVRPSDWRYIATVSEAVDHRIRGIASAKQTPLKTAEILHDLALRTEQALKEAGSAEPDLQALALLARFHGRRQMAADQLEYFYRTADATALHAARRELRGAVAMWERLVKLTDGAFPEEMAFGPDDNGHWKHRLPYVQHDLKRIDDRFAILEKFGRFDFGFDFGGPVAQRRGGAYRNDPYVLGHSIEPRFKGVDPATTYSEELGYGWVTNAERHAVPLKPTPFHEIRAAVKEPRSLPENALFGDSIRGMGAQLFRVRTGEGEFEVDVLGVGKRQIHAMNGVVDITMPESAWNVQGIVIRRAGAAHHEVPLQRWPVSLPSPEIVHAPPSHAASGKPLTLSVRVSAARGIVRLHYRPLNQLAKFATAEQPAARATFVIPAHEIPSDYDLMYYFEVLDRGQGWFHPDPVVTTPYYVIQTLPAGSPTSTAASR